MKDGIYGFNVEGVYVEGLFIGNRCINCFVNCYKSSIEMSDWVVDQINKNIDNVKRFFIQEI